MLIHMFLLVTIDAWMPLQARPAFASCSGDVGRLGRLTCDATPHLFRLCALIRHFTVASAILTHGFFELFFREATIGRWGRSDATARLGQRSSQTCARRLPWCLIDLAALPIGIACASSCDEAMR